MRKTILALGIALFAIAELMAASGHTMACVGSKVIFEDTFEDEAGGWSHKDTVEVNNGTFVFKLPADEMQSNLNVTFSVKDADICTEAVWPQGADNPILGAGLLFWGENNRTYYQFGILNNGRFWIARKQDGAWLGTIAANIDSPAIKTAPGASNTLRVDAKGSTLTFYINGTKVREVRGQAPSSAWRFGVSGDNFDNEKDSTVLFTNMKVTD
ncbi:MAG: family 16 glycoside hydrolase [Alphaproteobacteria bacterium]